MCLAAASSCQGSLPLGTALPTYNLLEVLHTQELHHGLPTSLGPVLPGLGHPAATGPKVGARHPPEQGLWSCERSQRSDCHLMAAAEIQ